ncbi:hypothetical protein BDW60DRAFT_221030 [Aspergillus nidulans var. acristatus]
MVFMTLQGLPTATENGGISFVTTLPAPIVQPSPILTPGRITTFPPIQQSSPINTGWPNSTNLRRDRMDVSWPAVYMETFGPSCTRSPMTIRLVSRAIELGSEGNRGRDILEIHKALLSDHNITPIVWPKWRLNEGAFANPPNNIL